MTARTSLRYIFNLLSIHPRERETPGQNLSCLVPEVLYPPFHESASHKPAIDTQAFGLLQRQLCVLRTGCGPFFFFKKKKNRRKRRKGKQNVLDLCMAVSTGARTWRWWASVRYNVCVGKTENTSENEAYLVFGERLFGRVMYHRR